MPEERACVNRTVIEHAIGFVMVNTRSLEPRIEPCVLPSQCEHVFYLEVPGRGGWSFVIRHDPRGRTIKYNVEEYRDGIEKEDDVEDQHELDYHVREEYGEKLVERDDVGDKVHQDDIDDDFIETNIER
jgi:hypothetical protein